MATSFGFAKVESSDVCDIPSVVLSSVDEKSSCKVFLYGATILSWISDRKERLFVSPIAVVNGSKAVRGGIPLVFPQFAQPNPTMLQHGFARNLTWDFVGSFSTATSVTAVLRVKDSEYTSSVWPHRFCLLYQITLSQESLETNFVICNVGVEDFQFHALQHTYLRVPHIGDVRVIGLQGISYADKLRNADEFEEVDDSIAFDKEVDRVYLCHRVHGNTSPQITVSSLDGEAWRIVSQAKTHLKTNTDHLVDLLSDSPLTSENEDQWRRTMSALHSDGGSLIPPPVDVVVWNPWITKAKALVDLNDEGFLDFVCVEPGCVSSYQTLPSNHVFSLSQVLTVESP